jgi:hypothetical protein
MFQASLSKMPWALRILTYRSTRHDSAIVCQDGRHKSQRQKSKGEYLLIVSPLTTRFITPCHRFLISLLLFVQVKYWALPFSYPFYISGAGFWLGCESSVPMVCSWQPDTLFRFDPRAIQSRLGFW